MNDLEITRKRIDVMKVMDKVLNLMNYIKVIDKAIGLSTDVKFKNFWNPMFISNVYLLKEECSEACKLLEEWFQIEKDYNLEIDFNLRASYNAMKVF